MPVRKETRRGVRRLIIDIVYRNPDGTRARYRRDAEIQTDAAARREERERIALLQKTGSPAGPLAALHAPEPPAKPVARDEAVEKKSAAPSFETVAREFLGTYAASVLKASTLRGYRVVLESFLLPRIGGEPIDAIGPDVVRRLDAELAAQKRARSTRRNMQLVLRSVLRRFCVERGYLPAPPPMPKLPRVGESVPRVLSDDEVERILAAARDRHRLALLLAAYAGLRAGEIRALRWRHVDLARGRLVVEESTCCGVTDVPKSGHQRVIPLAAPLLAALTAVTPRPRDGYVTTNPKGAQWTENALGKAFEDVAARAGVEDCSLHDLRHYFVTTLFRRGVGAPAVRALAGHETLITTQRYAHAVQVDLEEAIRRLCGNKVETGPEVG